MDLKNFDRASQGELLQELASGNRKAFELIYCQYYSTLYLHAYNRLRDSEAAKDIVHDLFAAIWAKRSELHIHSGLSSYLYNSVRNRVIDHISHQNVTSRYIADFSAYLDRPVASTDHLVRERQLEAIIEQEIASLPPQIQKVFEMSRKQHLSHKEIAAKLNLSEHTVRGYMKDALKVLRVRLGDGLLIALAIWIK